MTHTEFLNTFVATLQNTAVNALWIEWQPDLNIVHVSAYQTKIGVQIVDSWPSDGLDVVKMLDRAPGADARVCYEHAVALATLVGFCVRTIRSNPDADNKWTTLLRPSATDIEALRGYHLRMIA